MDREEITNDIASKLLPEIQSLLDSYRDFNLFFKNLTKVLLLDECDIEAIDMPNKASDDGIYHNQKVLQFVYKDKSINFDLLDGGLLTDNFSIISNTGEKIILFSLDEISNITYSEEELIEKINILVDYDSKLKLLKYTYNHLEKEDFKRFLQSDYDIIFTPDDNYIIKDNCKFFVNVDLDSKEVELTGNVSFYKEDDWQENLNLEDELRKIREANLK